MKFGQWIKYNVRNTFLQKSWRKWGRETSFRLFSLILYKAALTLSINLHINLYIFNIYHCVKRVQIRSFFWSVFSRIWTEYRDLLRKSPYSVLIRKNTNQKNTQGYDQNRKLFRTNNFVLAHSSAKKIFNEQLTLKSLTQWYHMTECDVIQSLLS